MNSHIQLPSAPVCLGSILAVLCLTIFSSAQQTDTLIPRLDNMVITATRTSRSAADIPTAVTVIGIEQIESSPARNVDDLMMNKAGMSVRRVVGMGEGVPGDISMRGVPGAYTAARVLVLVDGIPTNAAGAPFLVLNQIPNEMIERVEIIKGPFSGLYGANAFNGVINIITRSPGATPHLQAFSEFWPGLYWGAGGFGGFITERISLSGGGGVRRVDNYLVNDSAIADGSYDKVSNRDYRDNRFLGKADFQITPRLKATIQARYFNSLLGYGLTRSLPVQEINTGGTVALAGPSLEYTLSDKVNLRASGYVRRLTGSFFNESLVTDTGPGVVRATQWTAIDDDGQISVQSDIQLPGQVVTAGVDYLYNTIEFEPTTVRETGAIVSPGTTRGVSNGGLYLQDDIVLFEKKLALTPGIRLDYHSRTGVTVSPRIAIGYRPIDWLRARVSTGKGFRSPSLVELYMPEFVLPGGTKITPDSTVKPERITAVDGGVDVQLPANVAVSLTGFYNRMTDLISPWIDGIHQPAGAGTAYQAVLSYRNASQATSAGVECEATVRVLNWLAFAANYTFTFSEETTIREPLDYVPRSKAGLTLMPQVTIGLVRLSGEGSVMYLGERQFLDWQGANTLRDNGFPPSRKLPAAWRFDSAVRASLLNDRVWVAIAGSNLSNRVYQEHGGVDVPGRMVSLKIGGGL